MSIIIQFDKKTQGKIKKFVDEFYPTAKEIAETIATHPHIIEPLSDTIFGYFIRTGEWPSDTKCNYMRSRFE